MSRKHWSDLFLFAAAASLVLAVVLSNYGRLLSILVLIVFFIAGTMTRRGMV